MFWQMLEAIGKLPPHFLFAKLIGYPNGILATQQRDFALKAF